jgi:hypothetical protein
MERAGIETRMSMEDALMNAERVGPPDPFDLLRSRPVDRGATVFANAAERDRTSGELAISGMLVVELEGIGPSIRGRLRDAVDDAIERELSARGAAGAGISSSSDPDAALSDQLFRARRIGAPGIAIVLGPLRAAAGALGALEPEDCATLRFIAAATSERPVVLLLDERDARTGGYGPPSPLGALLAFAAHTQAVSACEPPGPAPSEPATPAPIMTADADADVEEPDAEPDTVVTPLVLESPPLAGQLARQTARHTAGASVVEREEAWRAWTLQLTAARGPQPLSALERVFAESYMPLTNAIGEGLDDPKARSAQEEFKNSFARSYTEAFPTFASTTKRPRMVLDVHEIATRIARLHGARNTRMLLVDGMRWDVSRLVVERLAMRLGNRAALTDELVLWSALPTTTMRQLETIARGVDALRSPSDVDSDAEPPRGRTAEYVRRLRVGPRELHKLDIVEARLQAARGRALGALPEIADASSDAIARHTESLAPNTLLFVFGDHGFWIDRAGVARQGDASPEEVLVGAFALLVGDVH